MAVVLTYLAGLAVAHIAWFYFFVTGHLLRRRAPAQSCSLADLVITSGGGMAVSGFALVLLGFTRMLNPYGLAVVVLCEAFLFWQLRGDNWLSGAFWKNMLRRMLSGWSVPAVFVYVVLLVLALPAVLPPTRGDVATYHLAYAVEWALDGRIRVDRFLRFPYYANGFLLFYSALFVLKLGDYCAFLTWLCGLLSCLGVLAFQTQNSNDPRLASGTGPQRYLAPLALALSPTFIQYLGVATVDVPIGAFLVMLILCAYCSAPGRTYERELIAVAAFCAGMKLTLLAYLPLFVGSLWFALRGQRGKRLVLLTLALLTLSLPWYLRNFLVTGDPVPPILNLYFHRPDPVFSAADAQIYSGALTRHDPAYLLLLPLRLFSDSWSQNFHTIDVNSLVLLVYAPVLCLAAYVLPHLRRRIDAAFTYLSAAVVYLTIPWLFSSLGRYGLYWYPSLAAWAGVLLKDGYQWARNSYSAATARRFAWISVTAAGVFLLCPSPSRYWCIYFRNQFVTGLSLLSVGGKEGYRQRRVPAYQESRAVIETLNNNSQADNRVLTLGHTTPPFFFRQARIISVGDYFGPARFGDLIAEVRSGNCRPYLNRLRIAAVMIDPDFNLLRANDWYILLQRQLRLNGFAEYRLGRNSVPVFLKDSLEPAEGLVLKKRSGRKGLTPR